MPNSKSEKSKAARARTACESQKKIVEAGGWRLNVMLYPAAAAALRAEIERQGEAGEAKVSAARAINRMLERWAKNNFASPVDTITST